MTQADPQPDDQSEPSSEGSFTQVFFSEMLVRGGLLIGVMLLSFLGSVVGRGISDDGGALTGALVGLTVGVCLLLVVLSRRRP